MIESAKRADPVPGSICLQVQPSNDLHHCRGCDDLICGRCPAFACSCVSPGLKGQLRTELRAAARELKELNAISYLMGADMLTNLQRARVHLLTDVVKSLTEEVNRLDEDECGEFYEA